ncbi:MAG: sporulation protein YunB [Bacillota bacterium]
MRRRFSRRRKKFPVLLIIALVMFFIIYTYYLTERNIKPTLLAMSEIKARLIATQAINDAVDRVISSGDYDELALIIRDNTGKIAGVHANTLKINKITGETTNAVQSALENLETSTLKIPISNVFGSQVFANKGPQISVKIQPAGSVSVGYFTDFEAAGINQTRHMIYLTIRTTVRIIVPLGTNEIDVSTNVPVSETIIVGDVPESYISVPNGNNDYLNFVPTKDPIND